MDLVIEIHINLLCPPFEFAIRQHISWSKFDTKNFSLFNKWTSARSVSATRHGVNQNSWVCNIVCTRRGCHVPVAGLRGWTVEPGKVEAYPSLMRGDFCWALTTIIGRGHSSSDRKSIRSCLITSAFMAPCWFGWWYKMAALYKFFLWKAWDDPTELCDPRLRIEYLQLISWNRNWTILTHQIMDCSVEMGGKHQAFRGIYV